MNPNDEHHSRAREGFELLRASKAGLDYLSRSHEAKSPTLHWRMCRENAERRFRDFVERLEVRNGKTSGRGHRPG